MLGTADSRTSSNSSLNRLGSYETGKPDSIMNIEQKATNAILDSPVSTSSSQSNLSYDSSSQVRKYIFIGCNSNWEKIHYNKNSYCDTFNFDILVFE